jgi:hypothetical protein
VKLGIFAVFSGKRVHRLGYICPVKTPKVFTPMSYTTILKPHKDQKVTKGEFDQKSRRDF